MTYDEIMHRIMDDYNMLKMTQECDILGVFLFGSQNYECDTEFSDIDTKAIVIPTVDQMITGNIKISKTITRDNGECTVFDINSMHERIKKQNINFIEILFTKYYFINPEYEKLWINMRFLCGEIARANEYAAVHCIHGSLVSKMIKVFHQVPSNFESIEKYGYDNKAAADVIRLTEFLEQYIQKNDYNSCLIPTNADELVKLKTSGYLHISKIQKIIDSAREKANILLQEYINTHKPAPDDELLKKIDEITISCCKAYIKSKMEVESWPSLSC